MRRPTTLARALLLPLALLVTACGPGASATPGPTVAPLPTATPAAPTDAPSEAPTEAPSAGTSATIEAEDVGTVGTVLIAGSNRLTLYIFTKDVKDSGESVCTGGCLTAWPALTVAAGETPTAGPGIDGELGTITRADTGDLQVTYNGLPLYFFQGDAAPGDANGVYEFWEVVAP